jgi:hypothetical protein
MPYGRWAFMETHRSLIDQNGQEDVVQYMSPYVNVPYD